MIKFGSTAYKVIERYVRNLLATPDAQGIMRIESNQVVTKSAQDLAAKLNSYGVPESVIVNTDDVKNFAGQIANIEQQKAMQAFKKQMTPKKSADIVELKTGKKIDQSKGIMGGRQFPESEAEIKTKIEKQNKETIARMKMVDDAIDDAAEGFVMGDNKYNAELVAENLAQRRGLVYDDLSTRERAKIYGEAFDALSKKFRDDLAIGGRVGLKDGMSRRKFLQVLGGLAALPVVGKFFKGAKVASKTIPQVVKTPPAPGKPEWFDSLVNKVIAEGDDVTKQFAVKDRELVNTKQINDFAEVTVYRDLDTNTIRVNYGAKLRLDPSKPYERGNISRAVNDPDQIDLIVKGPEDIEPTLITNREGFVQRRGTKTNAEFEAYESEPRVVNYDGDIEFDGERVVNNVDDLMEDISPLEEYATGKKLTGEKAAKAQKKREDYERFTQDVTEQSDYLENKYGPGPEPDDFASGGRVGLLSGGGVIRVMLKKIAEQMGRKPSELLAVTNYKSLPAKVKQFLTKEQFELIKKDMRSRRVEQFENLRDMVKSRQEFDKSAEALKKMGMDISDTMFPLMNKAVTPGGTTADDLLMMEQVIKNLRMKDRKLNASGGLAGMLGE